MLRIRSADEVNHGTRYIYIKITQGNIQRKIDRMQDDHNDSRLDNLSYSTTLTISDTTIQSAHLATLISLAPGKPVELEMKNIGLHGDDFTSLGEALSKLVHLEKISLSINNSLQMPTPTKENLLVLGQALAKLPILQVVSITEIPHFWYLTEVILPLLQQPDPSLSRLIVTTMREGRFGRFAREHTTDQEAIPQFIAACSCLESLDLWMPFKQSYITALEQLIRNSTSLHKMNINGNVDTDNGDNENRNVQLSLVVLAEALQFNSSLQELSLFSWQMRFRYAPKLKKIEAESFGKVLAKHNYTLKEMRLPRPFGQNVEEIQFYVSQIQFYVSLNKAGRAKLLGTPSQPILAPAEEWFQALARQNDVSIIFFFLQANLTLFHCNGKTTGSKKRGRSAPPQGYNTGSSIKSQRRAQPAEVDEADLLLEALNSFKTAITQNPSAFSSEKCSKIAAEMKEVESLLEKK